MKTVSLLLISFFVLFSCKKDEKPELQKQPNTLDKGLIAYYAFNGNANDGSGNSYHLIASGVESTKDRNNQPNKAYYFNGSTSFMSMPNMEKARALDSFAIIFWIKPQSLAVQSDIFSFTPYETETTISHQLSFIKSSNAIKFYNQLAKCEFGPYGYSCAGPSVQNSIEDPTNKWTHVVFGKEGQTQYLLVNGQKFSMNLDHDLTISLGFGGRIGVGRSQDVNFFRGSLDEIRIYNRFPSETEIQQLIQSDK
jgi:hypothetical protein